MPLPTSFDENNGEQKALEWDSDGEVICNGVLTMQRYSSSSSLLYLSELLLNGIRFSEDVQKIFDEPINKIVAMIRRQVVIVETTPYGGSHLRVSVRQAPTGGRDATWGSEH